MVGADTVPRNTTRLILCVDAVDIQLLCSVSVDRWFVDSSRNETVNVEQ